ncbi:MAG TPA: hypothetical protein VFQ53_24080 [Kofleriaceae bacterium]|nr:hypothetical protein [Kofleriaceae bacterium]
MRNLILTCSALVAIAACGPSNKDVAVAKTARFKGDKLQLFAAAKGATESKHTLAMSDETTLTIQTKGRWFTPEGLASNWNPEDLKDGKSRLEDKSLNIALIVKLLPDADNWVVDVTPVILRFNSGMPNPEPVDPKAADVPGWATGKADQLAYEIYKALRPYEVKGAGGVMPAPDPKAPVPSGPTPEPTPAPPAEGSAAPNASATP